MEITHADNIKGAKELFILQSSFLYKILPEFEKAPDWIMSAYEHDSDAMKAGRSEGVETIIGNKLINFDPFRNKITLSVTPYSSSSDTGIDSADFLIPQNGATVTLIYDTGAQGGTAAVETVTYQWNNDIPTSFNKNLHSNLHDGTNFTVIEVFENSPDGIFMTDQFINGVLKSSKKTHIASKKIKVGDNIGKNHLIVTSIDETLMSVNGKVLSPCIKAKAVGDKYKREEYYCKGFGLVKAATASYGYTIQ